MFPSVPRKIAIVDCDGVCLDYNAVFPDVWLKAFGERLKVVRPDSYHARHRYGIATLSPAQHRVFKEHFGAGEWARMPALPGAVEGCAALVRGGYEVVCVTAMPAEYQPERLANLQALGFPIRRVIATGRAAPGTNPKLAVIEALQPELFVDDLAINFAGVPEHVHTALVDQDLWDSPNHDCASPVPRSRHRSLGEFAGWWVQRSPAVGRWRVQLSSGESATYASLRA
jgi:hypothetical protein